MKKGLALFLNLIVVLITAVAVGGYFFTPFTSINLNIALTPEVADVLFEEPQNPTEEEKVTYMMIDELALERITLSPTLTISAKDALDSALSKDLKYTDKILYKFADSVVDSIDENKLSEFESAIAKASIKTVIKTEIEKFADEIGKSTQEVMTDIGIDDTFISDKTTAILDSLNAENATVDSVTDTVMSVVDEVYDLVENSEHADLVAEFTSTEREETENAVKDLMANVANESGEIPEDFVSQLFATLLSSEENQTEANLPAPTNGFIAFEGENPDGQTDVRESLRQELYKMITPTVSKILRTFLVIGVWVSIVSVAAWLWIIAKMILKAILRNPLVKLKPAIIFGWIPYVILGLLPAWIISIIPTPPAFLVNLLGDKLISTVSTLFASGFSATFATSAIFSAICAGVLFVYGIIYSIARKAM